MRRTLSLTLLLLALLAAASLAAGPLVVHFIDVGQGDAILVQFPGGKTMLVDGGPTAAGPKVADYLAAAGVKALDAAVSTHPHEDHIGGLPLLLDRFPVRLVVDPGFPHTSQTYERYLRKIDDLNIPFKLGRKGMTLDLDPSVAVRVLWPDEPLPEEINDSSVVLHLSYGTVSFLLTGDISAAVDPRLGPVRTTVLKVAHHGSATSGSSALLRSLSGKAAVISAGAGNSYGHPTAQALKALESAGYRVYRTDQAGSVKVTTDGRGFKVETLRQGAPPTGPPAADPVLPGLKYYGSRNSDAFHLAACRYAKSIKAENLVVFESRTAAVKAGRKPCRVCRP